MGNLVKHILCPKFLLKKSDRFRACSVKITLIRLSP